MLNYFKIPLVLLVIFAASVALIAQPPLNSAKRMKTLKKMKMLEVLEFENEKETNAFLVKYDVYEDKIDDQKQVISNAQTELQRALENDKEDSKIKELTNNYIKALNNMHDIIEKKNTEMGKVLSTENYAKFLLFEEWFNQRLRREVMQRAREIIRKRHMNGRRNGEK